MIETPHIVRTEPQHYAAIQFAVPFEEVRNIMGPGVQKVFRTLQEQGIEPTGPWFTHHFKRPNPDFDFEICVPVDTPIRADGDVYPAVWPAMRVARTVYHGEYSGLPGRGASSRCGLPHRMCARRRISGRSTPSIQTLIRIPQTGARSSTVRCWIKAKSA